VNKLNIADAGHFPGAEDYNAKALRDSDTFGMVHFSLALGGFIALHNMPFEVCFLVLSGTGTLTVNDEPHNVAGDYCAVCLPQARRGWRNYSLQENLNVLVLKIKKDRKSSGNPVEVRRIADELPAKNPHGVDVKRVYEGEHALVSIITLKPDEKLIRHITPVDVFFYVLSGSGVLEIGDERETIHADTVVDSPKGIPHCWYNESGSDLRVLVVKTPRPTTPTQFV
jgi:quercetin dioxygenase-like cupin family protein